MVLCGRLNKGLVGLVTGRNKRGVIVFRRRCGRNKNLYRVVDLCLYLPLFLPYLVVDLVYDGFRTAYLMVVFYINGIVSYRLAVDKVALRLTTMIGQADVSGNVLNVEEFLIGKESSQLSHNLTTARFARASGSFFLLLKLDIKNKLALVKLMSGKKYLVPFGNRAVVGSVIDSFKYKFKYGKAGRKIRFGLKQVVQGIARNPVDHPNGGRTPGGKVYRSFSFKVARSSKKTAATKFVNLYIKKIYNKKLFYR